MNLHPLKKGGMGWASFYTEPMDAEGWGRKLLLTPSCDPRKPLKNRTDCGYHDSISQSAHCASTFERSQCRHCKERLPGPRKCFWATSGSLSPKTSERKRHINFFHINFLCLPSSPGLSQGQTGFVPGTNPVKSGFH